MSSTNRGTERLEADFYETPAWCVRRLLEDPEISRWLTDCETALEPCVGGGAIIRACAEAGFRPRWTLGEKHHTRGAPDPHPPDFYDFLPWAAEQKRPGSKRFGLCLTNPPYSLAQEFIEAALPLARNVVMLLRLNFLSSAKRHQLMREHTPDVYILPNRPSFTGGRKTDSIEYAWFHFPGDGRWLLLGLTPKEERRG